MTRSATLKKPIEVEAVTRAKEHLRAQQWTAAVAELTAAELQSPLDALELVELGQACLLIGDDHRGIEILTRAHQAFLAQNQTRPAARCAFWLGFLALLNGDAAKANGWLSRAERLIEEHPECVERGYLLLAAGYRGVHGGNPAEAYAAFGESTAIAKRFGDADLAALALQGQGRSLIRRGEIARGVALLDEAMVAVTAGEVSALCAGGVYCSVLDACGEIFDLRRAQEWTAALEQWCASQPDLVPYRGPCLVRRAEILHLHGAWDAALQEAQRACERTMTPVPRVEAGAAHYRLAELHRLRGEFEAAEEAYRQAGRWMKTPHPGLALLRFAQGEIEAASAAIRRIADEARESGPRARVLDAYVEIMIGINDLAAARSAADELSSIAQKFDAPLLDAISERAQGAVLLAEGKAKEALSTLRKSWSKWCELDAPYEGARTRVLMARACGALDDCDAAKLELELAREVFERLGARPDLKMVEGMASKKASNLDDRLSAREVEVLKLVATGKTNRAIAAKLGISEKTVARHLSNIFNKLDISSRAAATAFAYENGIV